MLGLTSLLAPPAAGRSHTTGNTFFFLFCFGKDAYHKDLGKFPILQHPT